MNEQDPRSHKPTSNQSPTPAYQPAPETPCDCIEEKPCPDPKPCPPPPMRPCPPAPCAQFPPDETPPGEYDQEHGSSANGGPGAQGSGQSYSDVSGQTSEPSGPGAGQPPQTLREQLEALRQRVEHEEKELQKYPPLQLKLNDDTARMAAIQQTIDAQAAASITYVDFYRSIDLFRSSLECSIQTIRCQLELTEKQRHCIRKAIATVDARVQRVRARRDAHNAQVARLEQRQKRLDDDLAWATKWLAFFQGGSQQTPSATPQQKAGTTPPQQPGATAQQKGSASAQQPVTGGLQQQVTAQRDDLKGLLAKADPSKDQCEVWFYLYEMELLIKSARTDDEGAACYRDNINISTFLDCWSPKCYMGACEYWQVAYNNADSAKKVGEIELAEAQKRATRLATEAQQAESSRRDWIMKEIKVLDCCGPLSKCP